jgi:hypothetical protein
MLAGMNKSNLNMEQNMTTKGNNTSVKEQIKFKHKIKI